MRRKIILAIWVSLALLIRLLTIISVESTGNHEAEIAELIYMSLLSFPLGLLAAGFYWIFSISGGALSLGKHLHLGPDLTEWAFWFLFLVVGYTQWFLIVPKLFLRLKKSKTLD